MNFGRNRTMTIARDDAHYAIIDEAVKYPSGRPCKVKIGKIHVDELAGMAVKAVKSERKVAK